MPSPAPGTPAPSSSWPTCPIDYRYSHQPLVLASGRPSADLPSMSAIPAPLRSRRLAPFEVLFLAAVILGWAVLVVLLGKDMSWDFRNYHWYIPYAFLHGRLGFDVAVAHQATYYNPFLDVPFYLLATHLPSWFALGVLGGVQGASVVPLYLIARSMLRTEQRKLGPALLALFCM